MPVAWIEKLENEQAKQWPYGKLISGDVIFAGDRTKKGYQCVVAEVPLDDNDTERFNIPKGVTVIMSPKDQTRSIDDPAEAFAMDEIKFDLECSD